MITKLYYHYPAQHQNLLTILSHKTAAAEIFKLIQKPNTAVFLYAKKIAFKKCLCQESSLHLVSALAQN